VKSQLQRQATRLNSSMIGKPNLLTSTDFVDRNIGLIVPMDCTWHLPNVYRDAQLEYKKCHLKNARYFDIDAIKSNDSPLPHMLPSALEFTSSMEQLGISDSDYVVLYDSYGVSTVTRVWWTLKVFGHEKVSVMSGGLPKWVKEGRSVYDEDVKFKVNSPLSLSLFPFYPTLFSVYSISTAANLFIAQVL
jgi:3-mercaptopyruvate sulfurtransferase SseA